MYTRRSSRHWALAMACGALASSLMLSGAHALPRTWIGGNVDWVDGGLSTNWNPNDEPDADDEAIFNTANTVNLGSNNAVNGLTLSGGIDLSTNDFDLTVDGLVQLSGAGTNLFIRSATGSVNADDVVINSGGILELAGGTLTMDEEVGSSLIDINAGGALQGNGIIGFSDNPGVATPMLVNDGTLTALSRGLTIFSPPPVGTLTISDVGLNGRLDLDGSGEAGVVSINRNQKLLTEMQLFDAFNGTLNLFHNSTLQFNPEFTLGAGGSIVVDNGFVAGGLGFSDIAADTSFIVSALLNQTGGTINVVDTDGTLQIDAPFTMSGGAFTNSGTVIFNGNTSITTAPGYAPSSLNAQTIVNANVTINDAAGNFNWDGSGAADTTVNNGSLLSITANQIDTGDNTFGGTITLNGGSDLTVNVTAASWTVGGILTKNDVGTSTVGGDRINITGQVNANAGTLDLPAVTTSSTAAIDVTGTLTLGAASELAGGDIDGTGLLRMEGSSTVTANTVISVDTFDWDGLGSGTSHTINSGVTLAINTLTFDSDGDMDDPINLAGSDSVLAVNGPTQWTMNQAINANNAGVGTAVIGGAARLVLSGASAVLNVNGNTNIGGPLTFGAGSTTSIDAGFTLDLISAATDYIYSGGTISGAGTFSPGSTNVVTANSTINVTNFDLDGGTWTIQSGAELTFNVTDYEPGAVTNSFESTITLNNGAIFTNSPDPAIVMNGTLNMNASGGVLAAEWNGDAIDIGNDAGVLDADLNVTGDGNVNSQARFFAPVTFKSDADVDVPAGASLVLSRVVNFDTVNAANSAEFTGAGNISFNDDVNVNEAATLNMVGGTVDLDGNDAVGDLVNIDAPLTINAQTMAAFGRANGGGGINTLDINNSVGTGVLTVNLDDANAHWTLNGPGVMNLVNDNTEATLLAGSDVNIDGTVNVTGDVRSLARLDISGVVNINTAGQPLRLAGGSTSDPNTISGATISGAGLLGADTGAALHGFGTINAGVDFDGASNLFADNGTLTVNGSIIDVNRIGTDDADGVLNVVNAWDTGVSSFVQMDGGVIQGGAMTINNINGVSGKGLITSRLINNVSLRASGGTLIAQTPANDSDWDGAGSGALRAINAGTLELRDVGPAFAFTGTVEASADSRVFANGFALDFNPTSTLSLTAGTYESTSSTDIGGTVLINAGSPSTIKVSNNFFLTFEAGSSTTLNGNLRLENNNITVEAGAAFSGTGAIVVPDGSHLVADANANMNVLLDMQGSFRPANSEGVGRVDIKDLQFANTSELFVELTGTGLNQFDRLVVSGNAIIDGYLNIDIDGGFVPTLGQTFSIVNTAAGISGTFDYADFSGMPAGRTMAINYLANAVQLIVVTTPNYAADFDNDGDVDLTDLAIWQGAFNLNQLGDANGDNITDGSDWTIWRDTFGSTPTHAVTLVAPEPASLTALAGGILLVARRRRDRSARCARSVHPHRPTLVAAVATVALASVASAAPSLSVINGGLNGSNNREWLVRVAPDPALFVNGDGSVAVELGFNIVGGGQLVSASVNTADWPWNLPGRNPFAGGNTVGLQVNTASDTVFASLGSNPFNSGAPVQVLTIETLGSGPTTLTWGGHNFGTYIGSRLSQNGLNFNNIQGSVNSVGIPGDFDLDGDLDANDIDLLSAAQQGPVPPANAIFDVTGNNNVNSVPNSAGSDADHWVRILKDTEYGDANLDGSVNFDDLLIVAQHYNAPSGGWASGSFDGQAGIDFDDLLMLAQHYGFVTVQGQSGIDDSMNSRFGNDWTLARSLVPEPVSAVAIAGLCGGMRRRCAVRA